MQSGRRCRPTGGVAALTCGHWWATPAVCTPYTSPARAFSRPATTARCVVRAPAIAAVGRDDSRSQKNFPPSIVVRPHPPPPTPALAPGSKKVRQWCARMGDVLSTYVPAEASSPVVAVARCGAYIVGTRMDGYARLLCCCARRVPALSAPRDRGLFGKPNGLTLRRCAHAVVRCMRTRLQQATRVAGCGRRHGRRGRHAGAGDGRRARGLCLLRRRGGRSDCHGRL